MSSQLCTEPPFNYNGKNIKKQEELNINNIQYFLSLYYSGKYFNDGCGPGDLYIKTLLYDENREFKQRVVFIDPTTIIIIKNNQLVTITNLSFTNKKYDMTYIKLKNNINKNYYFGINFWKNNNVYYFDLIISLSSTGNIYKINSLSAKSDGAPEIKIQNNNICMIYNNKILIQKPIMDFFYYSLFGQNNDIYEINRFIPLRVEMPKLNVFGDIYYDKNIINKINEEEINLDFIYKNNELLYNADIYERELTDNLNSFVSRSDIVLNVPLDIQYPDLMFKKIALKYAIIASVIGFVILLILFLLLILEKRKHK